MASKKQRAQTAEAKEEDLKSPATEAGPGVEQGGETATPRDPETITNEDVGSVEEIIGPAVETSVVPEPASITSQEPVAAPEAAKPTPGPLGSCASCGSIAVSLAGGMRRCSQCGAQW